MSTARALLGRVVVGAGIALAVAAGGSAPALADNCSSPADCEQTAGYNTVIAVVGGVAAVAAAAAAAIAAANAAAAASSAAATGVTDAPPGGDGTSGDEPPEIVIIQIEPGVIDVTPDQPGQFTVTGWRVGQDGTPHRADDIPLHVAMPSDPALSVQPTDGTGQLIVTVRLVGTPLADTAQITASGSGAGGTASQQVTVNIGGGYELELY